jgi:hypothetical protein
MFSGYWRHMGWGQPAALNGVVHYVYAQHGVGSDPGDIMYLRCGMMRGGVPAAKREARPFCATKCSGASPPTTARLGSPTWPSVMR